MSYQETMYREHDRRTAYEAGQLDTANPAFPFSTDVEGFALDDDIDLPY